MSRLQSNHVKFYLKASFQQIEVANQEDQFMIKGSECSSDLLYTTACCFLKFLYLQPSFTVSQ